MAATTNLSPFGLSRRVPVDAGREDQLSGGTGPFALRYRLCRVSHVPDGDTLVIPRTQSRRTSSSNLSKTVAGGAGFEPRLAEPEFGNPARTPKPLISVSQRTASALPAAANPSERWRQKRHPALPRRRRTCCALRKLMIGKHGSPWTPETARAEAKRLLGEVTAGRDPATARQASRKALTFNRRRQPQKGLDAEGRPRPLAAPPQAASREAADRPHHARRRWARATRAVSTRHLAQHFPVVEAPLPDAAAVLSFSCASISTARLTPTPTVLDCPYPSSRPSRRLRRQMGAAARSRPIS